jgi:stage VI sporulation protein D
LEQSYLRFSLEESIWFKRGQEVAEFLSIALDPVVSVDEYEQYITILGALELSGEYLMAEGEESSADSFDFASHRFIQHVSTREDGISELSHRFPIDITIPKNRIYNLEDVYVMVESFDYDLDENGRLLVTADISISGISEVPLDEPSLAEEEEEDLLFEPFEVVARKEVYEEEQRKQQVEEETSTIFNHVLEEQNEEQAQEAEAIPRKETKQKEEKVVPLNNNEYPEEKKEKGEKKEKEEKEEKEETAAQLEENELMEAEEENVVPQQEAKVSIGSMKENDDDEMEKIDENEKTKAKSENTLYLTKLFAKNQGEEFTKVKICIVQQGDSLDKIAERYDITVQQLLRANQLESPEEIHEGQLLYIPALAGSRSS